MKKCLYCGKSYSDEIHALPHRCGTVGRSRRNQPGNFRNPWRLGYQLSLGGGCALGADHRVADRSVFKIMGIVPGAVANVGCLLLELVGLKAVVAPEDAGGNTRA